MNAAAVGLLGDGGDIEDAETGTVVGLVAVVAEDVPEKGGKKRLASARRPLDGVEEQLDDLLVVVDGLARGLVVAGLLGVLEVTNVPDEGCGMAVGSRAATVVLVVLVVEDEVLLVLSVEHPALVSVGGTLVAGNREELGVLLVGNVVDGL